MKFIKLVATWFLKRCAAGAFLLGMLGTFVGISVSIGFFIYWTLTNPIPGVVVACFVIGYFCLAPEKKAKTSATA
ncbi:MAG: hypothetical protein AAGA30_08630 [Planctomycetota bacterium]